MKIKRFIFPALFSIALLSAAPAQNTERSLPFRVISLDNSINDLALISGDELVDCSIPARRRSPVMIHRGGPAIRFVKQGTPIPEGGIAALEPILEMPVVSEYKNPLYILYPKAEGSADSYGYFAIEDSPGAFEGGSSMFVNLSPYPLILMLGEKADDRIQLASREKHIHAFEGGNINVRLRIAAYAEEEVKKGMDTRIFPVKTHRDVYFIYPAKNSETGKVRMRLLRENLSTAMRAFTAGTTSSASP